MAADSIVPINRLIYRDAYPTQAAWESQGGTADKASRPSAADLSSSGIVRNIRHLGRACSVRPERLPGLYTRAGVELIALVCGTDRRVSGVGTNILIYPWVDMSPCVRSVSVRRGYLPKFILSVTTFRPWKAWFVSPRLSLRLYRVRRKTSRYFRICCQLLK